MLLLNPLIISNIEHPSNCFFRGHHQNLTLVPLVAPGAPSLLNFKHTQPALEQGFHFNLYNNVWGTNFPMWYDEDARFRFVVRVR